MSLLSTCRSTAPAPARMMTSAVPFLILFLAGVSFAERYWVDFGARRRAKLLRHLELIKQAGGMPTVVDHFHS